MLTAPPTAHPTVDVRHGNALEVLATLPDNCVHAVVTDPPYGMAKLPTKVVTEALGHWLAGERTWVPATGTGMMSKRWDRFVPPPALWDECLRVLRPGGYLVAFAAPRTQDLMGMSLRLAGFEILDTLHWVFGQGMPKSTNVAREIDKRLGVAGGKGRAKMGAHRLDAMTTDGARDGNGTWNVESGRDTHTYVAGSPQAEAWQGFGTAIKPGHEPIILAMKPRDGTVAANVLAHGAGALNIDACRVGWAGEADEAATKAKNQHATFGSAPRRNNTFGDASMIEHVDYDAPGRWPANVLISHSPGCVPAGQETEVVGGGAKASRTGQAAVEFASGYEAGDGFVGRETTTAVWVCVEDCPARLMDAQSGRSHSRKGKPRASSKPGDGWGMTRTGTEYDDHGGGSRFFQQFAAEPVVLDPGFSYTAKAGRDERPVYVGEDGREVRHVSVKPLALMRWLARLTCPPGGLLLDPCAGTGTTGEAALLEGMSAILVENEADYLPLIAQRIARSSPDLERTGPEVA